MGLICFLIPVEKWKKTRKAVASSFSPKILPQFLPVMSERATIITKTIKEHCGSGVEVDFFPYFFNASFDTLCGELKILLEKILILSTLKDQFRIFLNFSFFPRLYKYTYQGIHPSLEQPIGTSFENKNMQIFFCRF